MKYAETAIAYSGEVRLPFPIRISYQKALIASCLLFVVQQLEHTELAFSVLLFAFIILSVCAFNFAGGFSRASGAYIFWFATLTCILGCCWKTVLGEPGQSNLMAPDATMAIYVCSMLMMIVSLFVSRRFRKRTIGISGVLHADNVNMGLASVGCLTAYIFTVLANDFLPGGSGSLVGVINQVNMLLPFAILLGTIHAIRISHGQRSVTVVSAVASIFLFVYGGLVYYSKQGMFTPVVCWIVAAASQRYRIRLWQIALFVGFAVYSVMVLSPLSQVGRAVVPDGSTDSDRLSLSIDLLSHPKQLRASYLEESSVDPDSNARSTSYFDSPQGLLDRLTILPMDDRLVAFTLQGHTVGNARLAYFFINWIPHFILPNKESLAPEGTLNPGNQYAHEMGLLSPDDYTTGVSFSPSAEAFHMSEWLGIFLIAPFVWTLLFITVDLVCGDLRKSPFGLIAIVAFAHVAPESLLGGVVYFIFFGNLGIIVSVVFCSYAAPIFGMLISGRSDAEKESATSPGEPGGVIAGGASTA